MTTIVSFLGEEHQRCDSLFVEAERLADRGDFAAALQACHAFTAAMEHHFALEESRVFPAFEQVAGSDGGPTAVMRHEHQQMRGLFHLMTEAIAEGQQDEFFGVSETLLILMQQHNLKEEQILYPKCDQLLAGEVVQRIQEPFP